MFLRAPANFGSGHQTAESFLVLLYCVMVVGPTSCITCVLMFREYNASIVGVLKSFQLAFFKVPALLMSISPSYIGQFHIGEHLMAKNNLQNSLQFLVLMYR